MILIFRWSKWIVRRAWILENSLCIWIHRSSTFVIPETGMTCFPASMDLCIGFVQRRWILDYRVKTLCADVTQEASEKCEAGLRPWEFGLKGKTSKGKWEKDTLTHTSQYSMQKLDVYVFSGTYLLSEGICAPLLLLKSSLRNGYIQDWPEKSSLSDVCTVTLQVCGNLKTLLQDVSDKSVLHWVAIYLCSFSCNCYPFHNNKLPITHTSKPHKFGPSLSMRCFHSLLNI